jgi:alanine dehydrogenase
MTNLTKFLSAAFEKRRPDTRLKQIYALLDTDFHIGEDETDRGNDPVGREKRVAIVPSQADELIRFLRDTAGIELNLDVVAGAGERAKSADFFGFKDSDYLDAGARRIVAENELLDLQPHPDLVFALKEPCEQEIQIPGPFLRVGATHLAGAHEIVNKMFGAGRCTALFDGGAVGRYSYKLTGGDERPIVASMSRLAGPIAAEKLLKLRSEQRRVVIFGGGPAGSTAAEYVLTNHPSCRVDLYDLDQHRLGALSDELARFEARLTPLRSEREAIKNGDKLREATGLIMAAVGDPTARAPKVVKLEDLKLMASGAAVVDIMIDQGGNIDVGQKETDHPEVVREQTEQFLKDQGLAYWSNVHMPSLIAVSASMEHGNAILPYLATLALVTSIEGGAKAATELILRRERLILGRENDLDIQGEDLVDALCQDLRNGLQLAINRSGEIEMTDPAIVREKAFEPLRRLIQEHNQRTMSDGSS